MKKSSPQTTTTTTAPPSWAQPYINQAAGASQNLYGQGNYIAPVAQQGINYASNVLGGNYLNSNPYLDATFNRAANAVTNQVQSNFGLAGRNARGADASGLATQGYNDLAAQIYGGNYQAERDRMQQTLGQAPGLGALSDPARALDDYIARLTQLQGGSGVTSSQIPMQRNVASGALSGGYLGYKAYGPWGALGGAVLGGLGG